MSAPSALRVALRRAAHQSVDRPLVFHDPFAVRLLGSKHAEALRRTPVRRDRPWSVALRAFAVARSCYAEEQLAAAVGRGVRHYCLLGAGLDTFAWRNPWPDLRVWEVDRPAMGQWKREMSAEAGMGEPQGRVWVSADLGDASLAAKLEAAGLRQGEPVFFALLGVAPYLAAEAFRAVLRLVQRQGPGSGLVLDYRLPRTALGAEEQRQHDSLSARLEAAGEPFRSWWTPEEMAAELHGFAGLEDLDTESINARYFPSAGEAGQETSQATSQRNRLAARGRSARIVCAWL